MTSVKYGYDGNGVIYKLNSYPAYPTTQHNCRVCTVALIITTIDGVVKLTIAGCATSCRIVIGSKEFWDQVTSEQIISQMEFWSTEKLTSSG